MADDINIKDATDTPRTVATDEIAGRNYQIVKLAIGADGSVTLIDASGLPVSGPLTDAQLRASAVPVSGPLTDAQLRAAVVPVSPNVSRAAGVVDANTQRITVASDGPLMTSIGAPADAAASSDTGSFSLLAFIKRALQNWTTLLARVPGNGQAAMAASLPVVIASNQSAVPVAENSLILTGAAAQTATVNNILENPSSANATDVGNFRTLSTQVVSTGTGGTFIFEQSNDNTNWVAAPVFNAALVTAVPITAAITATASAIIYTVPLRARYIRLRIATTITGGSIQAFSRISTEPWTAAAQLVASNVAANLNATVSGTVTANIGTGALAAGANAIGDVGVQYRANATGAGTPTNINSPATPAVQTIKGSAGRLLGFLLLNTNASARFFKVFNVVSPTLGTTSATLDVALPTNVPVFVRLEGGIAFSTAITCAVTGARGLTDNTAITGNEVTGFTVHA